MGITIKIIPIEKYNAPSGDSTVMPSNGILLSIKSKPICIKMGMAIPIAIKTKRKQPTNISSKPNLIFTIIT
jgi:hypothetical protein